jgi:hypothetical protein
MAAAIEIVRYYTAHAMVAFDVMNRSASPHMPLAKRVLQNISERGLREVSTGLWMAGNKPAWAPPVPVLREVFEVLVDYQWMTPQAEWPPPGSSGRRGRPPTQRFDVHEAVFEYGFTTGADKPDNRGSKW